MRRSTSVLAVVLALGAGLTVLVAQMSDAAAAARHCQTVLTCNFKKGGAYRGCLSSYTCRQCRFVTARCSIGGTSGTCRKIKCGWGA